MMRHLGLVLFCCAAVLLVSAVCVSPATGAQYTVAPSGGGFTSIQDAVTWASPLDTITVWSGTYPGTVKIDKKITLIGVDPAGDYRSLTREKGEPPLKSMQTVVLLRALLSRTAQRRVVSSLSPAEIRSKTIP